MPSTDGQPDPLRPLEPLERWLALQSLERLPRLGWLQAGLRQAESVAAHSHLAALLALHLAPLEEPPVDGDRSAALLLVHDAPEALLGDLPKSASELLPQGVKAAAELAAARRLLGPLALERYLEFAAQPTREARLAKACDRLALALCRLAYQRAGAGPLEGFRAGLLALDLGEFPAAEALLAEILAAEPGIGERSAGK